ncbi:MAG: hypothetical protein U1F27_11740 [Turneriella sp.]
MPTAIPELIGETAEVIREDSRVIVRAHDANHRLEDFIRAFVRDLSEKFHRPDIAPALEIILKELVTNAAKANFKKIFFAENGLLLENPEQYEEGILRFREIFSQEMFAEYGLKARDARLEVLIIFDFNADRFLFEIHNNVPMSSAEERRVREKLKLAMRCGNAGEFIMEHVDETEGAGLGLMLCIAALRSISVNPRYFSVATDLESRTVARIEVPLHSDYEPERERWQGSING